MEEGRPRRPDHLRRPLRPRDPAEQGQGRQPFDEEAQGKGKDEAAEGEDVDLNNYTAAEIKAALDKAGVDYPTSASKTTLVQIATNNDVSVD